MASKIFNGTYTANPEVPVNVDLNSYDYGRPWAGIIDELRLYDRSVPENEVQKLADNLLIPLYDGSNLLRE